MDEFKAFVSTSDNVAAKVSDPIDMPIDQDIKQTHVELSSSPIAQKPLRLQSQAVFEDRTALAAETAGPTETLKKEKDVPFLLPSVMLDTSSRPVLGTPRDTQDIHNIADNLNVNRSNVVQPTLSSETFKPESKTMASARSSTQDEFRQPIKINQVAETELRQQFAVAVHTALILSPKIKAVDAQSEAAEANIGEAKGQRWPQVDFNAASPNKQFGSGNRNKQTDLPSLGVNVATNLYDFGQTSRVIESREEQFNAATQAVAAQREEIAWQVSSTLFEINKQKMIINLSQKYVARMNELTSMLSGIVESDPGRRSELTQARGRLLQARSLLENAQSRARDSEITLRRLIGDAPLRLSPPANWFFSVGSLEQQLKSLERHPGILKAAAESRAAQKEAEAVKASGKPKLTWVISKSTDEDGMGRQQSWQTGLNVSWGLFRGGANNAAERAAIMRAESGRQLVQEQLQEYENRVRAADQDARSMQSRAILYANLTKESERIRKDFYDQWYHLGKRSLLDVLSAESDYYNNSVSEVSNRLDGYASIFKGYASAGYLVSWLNTGNLINR